MSWIKCSKGAYEKCPDSCRCGTLDQAIFLDDSPCHKFNQKIAMEDAKEQKLDLVAVVRCKDCKCYKESKLMPPIKFCYRMIGSDGKPVGYNYSDDDFCSYGERRANDENNA